MKRTILISVTVIVGTILLTGFTRTIPIIVKAMIAPAKMTEYAIATPMPEIVRLLARNEICASDKTEAQKEQALAESRAYFQERIITFAGHVADVRGRPQAYVAIIDLDHVDYSVIIDVPDDTALSLNKNDAVLVNGTLSLSCLVYGQMQGSLILHN